MRGEGLEALHRLGQVHPGLMSQVGEACVLLGELLSSGLPVQSGFVIPHSITAALWAQLTWPEYPMLQDFPHLALSPSVEEPAQLQALARVIERNLKTLTLPSAWTKQWQSLLREGAMPYLYLTPQIWFGGSGGVIPEGRLPLPLMPTLCRATLPALIQSLQELWVGLCQAQTLLVLQQQELRLAQVRLSVLVQPLHSVHRTGWLQISPQSMDVASILGLPRGVWQGEMRPEIYRLQTDTPVQHWSGDQAFVHKPTAKRNHKTVVNSRALQVQRNLELPQSLLQVLLQLGQALREECPDQSLRLEWMLDHAGTDDVERPKLLGILSGIPFPVILPPPEKSIKVGGKTDPVGPIPSDWPQTLAQGLGVSPGQIRGQVLVVGKLQDLEGLSTLQSPILVLTQLAPQNLPWLEQAAGLICERGGMTSHGAMMARELNRPAVVGVLRATNQLQTGQWVRVDGDRGLVYPSTPEEAQDAGALAGSPGPVELAPPIRCSTDLAVYIALSQVNSVPRVQHLQPEGVGLVRGEWLLAPVIQGAKPFVAEAKEAADSVFPWQQDWSQALGQVLGAFPGQRILYRSVDMGALNDPFAGLGLLPIESGQNPALGLRGMAWHRHCDRLLTLELTLLKAILAAPDPPRVAYVLPFVRSPQDVAFCLAKMNQVGLQVGHSLTLWIMAEVPALLYQLEDYRHFGIEGMVIGLSDLTQLLVGVDREQPLLADYRNESQAAIMGVTEAFIQRATAMKWQSWVSGDLFSYPAHWLQRLQGMGLSGISVDLQTYESLQRSPQSPDQVTTASQAPN